MRLLLATLLAAFVAAGALWLDVRLASRRPVARADVHSADRSTTVYLLDDDRWTVFRIPASARRIRLLSHANLLPTSPGSLRDAPIPYGIRYRLTTLGGEVVAEGDFEYVTGLVDRIDEAGRPVRRAFYEDGLVAPASLRRSHLDLATSEVLLLSLRSEDLAAPVHDVAVRVAYKHDVAERKLAYQWARKSEERRRQLVVSRVHGLVDLTDAEQRNLLLTRWSPVGPQGVEGADYRSRVFYYRDDLEVVPSPGERFEGPDELRCEPGLRATLGIPESGRFRLRFMPADGERDSPSRPGPVAIRHFGTHLGERSHFVHDPAAEAAFTADFEAGMLEIESPWPCLVEAFRVDAAGGEVPLPGRPSVVRAWRCGGGEDSEVAFVVGTGEGGDLVRLACRPDPGTREVAVALRWLDDAGGLVREVPWRVAPEVSSYDRLVDEDGMHPVSDPAEIVLRIPASATRLVVDAAGELVVSAHARPRGLVHRTRVPDDYLRAVPDPGRQPLWFPLWPADADELIRSFRAPLVRVQVRPPEDDAEILAGRFEWEDFDPVSGSLGNYLLTDRDPGAPARVEALPSLFMPVPVGEGGSFVVPGATLRGVEAPARRLVVVGDGDRPADIRVLVDGEPIIDGMLATRAGEFPLPARPPGAAGARVPGLRVDSSDPTLRAWINHVEPGRATRLKRFAHRFGPARPLRFRIDKAADGDELVTATWFAPEGGTEPSVIRVAIEPAGAVPEAPAAGTFTPMRREFVVRPGGAGRVDALGGPVRGLAEARRLFIPLGADLPRGTVEIAFTMPEGDEGYLILSRVRGGEHTWARYFREDVR